RTTPEKIRGPWTGGASLCEGVHFRLSRLAGDRLIRLSRCSRCTRNRIGNVECGLAEGIWQYRMVATAGAIHELLINSLACDGPGHSDRRSRFDSAASVSRIVFLAHGNDR